MRRLFLLLCVCASMAMLAGVPVDRSRLVKSACINRPLTNRAPALAAGNMTGTRICLLHLYDWDEDAMGHVTVSANDPYYVGGWTTTIAPGEVLGDMVFVGGMTMYPVSQPFKINGTTVTLEVGDDPVAVVTNTSTTSSNGVTTTVETTDSYYLVNEDWLVNYGAMADIHGTLLDDGTIRIDEGFAYYIDHEVTTTITTGNHSETHTDNTYDISLLMRDLLLLPPNGIHEFTSQEDGMTHQVDVYIRQSGDTVYVTNLYGLGWQEDYMVLDEDGGMTYPGQPLCDISDAENPNGAGLWYNAHDTNGTLGNEGNATPAMITWGLTVPTDNATVWPGWTANKLYFTNGSSFVIPSTPVGLRGDVNNDGKVTIADVTALINALLTDGWDNINMTNADCDLNGGIAIGDVTALINFLLTDTWSN